MPRTLQVGDRSTGNIRLPVFGILRQTHRGKLARGRTEQSGTLIADLIDRAHHLRPRCLRDGVTTAEHARDRRNRNSRTLSNVFQPNTHTAKSTAG